jgi:integrase
LDTRAAAIRETLTGIKRTHGTSQLAKAPAVIADLKAMIEGQPDTLAGLRNRALLLLGFAGALRRSELVSLDVEDLDFTSDGLVVTLRRSKTDQDAQGRQIGVPYGRRLKMCPVRSLQSWLEVADIRSGAIFREITRGDRIATAYMDKLGRQRGLRLSDKTVALVVKRAAKAAGFDPGRYAGHSLRGGLATSAAAAGATERSIMATTGHRSVQTVRRYIRVGELFRENAAGAVGL